MAACCRRTPRSGCGQNCRTDSSRTGTCSPSPSACRSATVAPSSRNRGSCIRDHPPVPAVYRLTAGQWKRRRPRHGAARGRNTAPRPAGYGRQQVGQFAEAAALSVSSATLVVPKVSAKSALLGPSPSLGLDGIHWVIVGGGKRAPISDRWTWAGCVSCVTAASACGFRCSSNRSVDPHLRQAGACWTAVPGTSIRL